MPADVQRPAVVPRIIGALVIALALFVIFNSNGRSINALDTRVTQHTALAIAATGRADLSHLPLLVEGGVARGYIRVVDGQARSSYPLLPALLAVPGYRIALDLGLIDFDNPSPVRLEVIGSVTAAALTAFTCALLYLVLAFRWPSVPAAVIAMACGLATPLWSTASQALWSHAPAALFLVVGLGMALVVPRDSRWRSGSLVMSGIFVVLAVFCRQLLVVFPVGLAIGLWRSGAPGRHVVMFSGGAAFAVLTMMGVNLLMLDLSLGGAAHLYTAGVTVDTHGVADAWSGRWAAGLAGVFVSPSRGLLIYMPVVLLAAFGARSMWREDTLARYTLVLPTALYIALWAKYAVWWGGHSFGPRFAADLAVPFALLAAGVLVRWSSLLPLGRAATVAALVWSVAIQGIGATFHPAGDWNGLPRDVDRSHERLWDWRDSQLVRTIGSGTYRQYRARGVETAPAPDVPEVPVLVDVEH